MINTSILCQNLIVAFETLSNVIITAKQKCSKKGVEGKEDESACRKEISTAQRNLILDINETAFNPKWTGITLLLYALLKIIV